MARLGAPEDSVAILGHSNLLITATGQYLVAPVSTPDAIGVFDAKGRFLFNRGRKGKGPGEFLALYSVFLGPGDSVHVFDLTRHTVFSPSWKIGRIQSVLAGGVTNMLAFPSGRWVGSSAAVTGDRHAALYVMNGGDSITRAFGPLRPKEYPWRHLAWSRDGQFWAASTVWDYDIELWDTAGTHIKTIVRRPPWFQPAHLDSTNRRHMPNAGQEPPHSSIRAIQEDKDGRLWVFSRVAKLHWHPSPKKHSRGLSASEEHDYTDTMVEVIDVARGELIASARIPFFVAGLAAPGVFYLQSNDEDGLLYLDVYRFQLAVPNSTKRSK